VCSCLEGAIRDYLRKRGEYLMELGELAAALVDFEKAVHTTGGRTIVDRTASLTYQATRPNGPGCEPVCQAASETWAVP
jgi:hypothetical protein